MRRIKLQGMLPPFRREQRQSVVDCWVKNDVKGSSNPMGQDTTSTSENIVDDRSAEASGVARPEQAL